LLAYKKKTGKTEKLSPENVWRRQDTAFFVGQKPKSQEKIKARTSRHRKVEMQPPSGDLETGAWHFYSFIKIYHQPTASGDRPNTKQRMLCL